MQHVIYIFLIFLLYGFFTSASEKLHNLDSLNYLYLVFRNNWFTKILWVFWNMLCKIPKPFFHKYKAGSNSWKNELVILSKLTNLYYLWLLTACHDSIILKRTVLVLTVACLHYRTTHIHLILWFTVVELLWNFKKLYKCIFLNNNVKDYTLKENLLHMNLLLLLPYHMENEILSHLIAWTV